MNGTLKYFQDRFKLDLEQPSPITINLSRYGILPIFKELNFTVGAEIGVEHGRYSAFICDNNPQMKLYCVDPYVALPYYGYQKDQAEVETFYEAAKKRLSRHNTEIIRETSMEAVKRFSPESLDVVFIDANHYLPFILEDIYYWSEVVRPGGIIYGHDYSDIFHVKIALRAFVEAFKVNPWFILHRGGKLIDNWMIIKEGE